MEAAGCRGLHSARILLPTLKSWSWVLSICRIGRFESVLSVRLVFFVSAGNAVLLVQVNRRPPTLLPRVLFGARTTRPLNGLIWPKDGYASIA